jgi:hypothetical protein
VSEIGPPNVAGWPSKNTVGGPAVASWNEEPSMKTGLPPCSVPRLGESWLTVGGGATETVTSSMSSIRSIGLTYVNMPSLVPPHRSPITLPSSSITAEPESPFAENFGAWFPV